MRKPWRPFTPTTHGKPTYASSRVIDAVQLAGAAAAIASRESCSAKARKVVSTIDFFRGPEGDFLRQHVGSFADPTEAALSLVAGRPARWRSAITIRSKVQMVTEPAARMLLTTTGTGRHLSRMWVGPPPGSRSPAAEGATPGIWSTGAAI